MKAVLVYCGASCYNFWLVTWTDWTCLFCLLKFLVYCQRCFLSYCQFLNRKNLAILYWPAFGWIIYINACKWIRIWIILLFEILKSYHRVLSLAFLPCLKWLHQQQKNMWGFYYMEKAVIIGKLQPQARIINYVSSSKHANITEHI